MLATILVADASPVMVPASEQARLWDGAVRHRAADLMRETVELDADALVARLAALGSDPALDAVAADAILFAYAESLRRMPVRDIPDAAIEWLRAYSPRAWRRHDESASALVPLFNLPAAAVGLAHEKRYARSYDLMLNADPSKYPVLLQAYVESQDRPTRRGMEMAVVALPAAASDELMRLVKDRPAVEFSPLHVELLIARHETEALSGLMATAPAARATDLINRGLAALSSTEVMAVGCAAFDHPDPGVRGVAIARTAAIAADDPTLRRAWLEHIAALLSDASVASAVAMQLAQWPEEAYADAVNHLKRAGRSADAARDRLKEIERLRKLLSDVSDDSGEWR